MNELRKLPLQNGYPAGVVNYNINDVLNRQQNRPRHPIITVPKKETILVLFGVEVFVEFYAYTLILHAKSFTASCCPILNFPAFPNIPYVRCHGNLLIISDNFFQKIQKC